MDAVVARDLWRAAEPFHAVTYFSPESHAAWAETGLRGFWRGYFATRAAPLGAVGAGVVAAAFYNFAPTMVERAVPEVWTMITPAGAWAARLVGVDRALRAVLGEDVADEAQVAAHLARAAAEACPIEGRVIGAACAAQAWPDEPHLALWQALTVLREVRGDGHNAALVAAGIGGCAAHVLAAAVDATSRAVTQPHRGWSDAQWQRATDDLGRRGLVDADGRATAAGRRLRADVEATTDRLSLAPWRALGQDRTADLHRLLVGLSGRVVEAGVVPVPNPMGAPWP